MGGSAGTSLGRLFVCGEKNQAAKIDLHPEEQLALEPDSDSSTGAMRLSRGGPISVNITFPVVGSSHTRSNRRMVCAESVKGSRKGEKHDNRFASLALFFAVGE